MSKLRADILYSNRFHSYNSYLTMDSYLENENFQESYIQSESEVFEVLSDSEGIDDPVSMEENNESGDETIEGSDDETESNFLEIEFNEYLQGWAEMLEEEERTILEEEREELIDDHIVTIDNTIHPAIDLNGKWKLETLFKRDIKFPF